MNADVSPTKKMSFQTVRLVSRAQPFFLFKIPRFPEPFPAFYWLPKKRGLDCQRSSKICSPWTSACFAVGIPTWLVAFGLKPSLKLTVSSWKRYHPKRKKNRIPTINFAVGKLFVLGRAVKLGSISRIFSVNILKNIFETAQQIEQS